MNLFLTRTLVKKEVKWVKECLLSDSDGDASSFDLSWVRRAFFVGGLFWRPLRLLYFVPRCFEVETPSEEESQSEYEYRPLRELDTVVEKPSPRCFHCDLHGSPLVDRSFFRHRNILLIFDIVNVLKE